VKNCSDGRLGGTPTEGELKKLLKKEGGELKKLPETSSPLVCRKKALHKKTK